MTQQGHLHYVVVIMEREIMDIIAMLLIAKNMTQLIETVTDVLMSINWKIEYVINAIVVKVQMELHIQQQLK